jgi:hypothetical protein
MREELKALDDLHGMDDLWQRVRTQEPRPDDPEPERPWRNRTRTLVLAAGALAFVVVILATLRPLGDDGSAPASVGATPTQAPSATPTQTAAVPKALVLRCGSDGATSVASHVEAQADGVHVKITGASPHVEFKGGGAALIDGTKAELVFSLAPGQNAVRCVLGNPDRGDYLPFEVVDPKGLWVDPTLDCPGRSKEVEYLDTQPLQVKGDPSDEMMSFTEEEFAGRFPDEGSVIRVGYPEADRPYFGFVSSAGSVLGIVGFHEGLPGDWLPEFYRVCQF